MDNIFRAIGRNIDDNLMKSYFGAGYTLPNFSNTTASTLTIHDLHNAIQKLEDESLEYTREFWRDLASKYGPYISATAHIEAIANIEQAGGLNPDARPQWLYISKHLDPTNIFFFVCSCLCHTSIGQRRLTMKGEWCCTCSAYEDI